MAMETVLQLLFDVQFLAQVLRLPAPHLLESHIQRDLTEMKETAHANGDSDVSPGTSNPTAIESIALSAKAATLTAQLEARLDPIDVADTRPRLASSVEECYVRTTLLLGGLTSVTGIGRQALMTTDGRDPADASAINSLPVAKPAARFQLLPVSAPVILAHSTRKQQQEQAVEMLSELAATSDSAPSSPASAAANPQPDQQAGSRFGFGRLGAQLWGGGGQQKTQNGVAPTKKGGQPTSADRAGDNLLFM